VARQAIGDSASFSTASLTTELIGGLIPFGELNFERLDTPTV